MKGSKQYLLAKDDFQDRRNELAVNHTTAPKDEEEDEKCTSRVLTLLTASEARNLKRVCKKKGMAISTAIRVLLKEQWEI